ncbi:MAG: LamG-like jellyroll fold domain-containing protein, partial [Phycisphaerales bacterium]
MLRKSVLVLLGIMVLGPAWSAFAGLDPDLIAWWAYDEGTGTVASDGSGNGNDGTLTNSPTWVEGQLNMALRMTGGSYVSAPFISLNSRSFTIALWMNPVLTGGSAVIFSQSQTGATNQSMHYRLGGDSSTDAPVRGVRMGFYSNDLDSPAGIFQDNTWYHVVFYYDYENKVRRIYVNGEQVSQGTSVDPYLGTSGNTQVGRWDADTAQTYTGIVDDVQIYHRALSDAQIKKIMKGLTDTSIAAEPAPVHQATDVARDVVLGWMAGEFAATHDVYFGTSFEDVNNATQPIQSVTDAAFDPEGLLEYGQTYYWRIDEVNSAPDYTVVKGEVWSFTTETYAYPITSLTAVASAQQATSPASNTINGSGLDELDQHGFDLKTMWVTPGGLPAWIEYTFDKVYKLHELWVWNANSELEAYMGFGAKDVVIEYSTDGETWAQLENASQFSQGTGLATYAANTIVDFGEVMAKYVKLTINDNWGATPMVSLSEVRFFYTPVQGFEPDPADDATGVDLGATLNWRPGREATSHQVYFGADANAVAEGTVAAKTVTAHSYTPASMDFGTTYYWKVDEVGDAGTYAGDVWSFTSQEFEMADDFESYTDDIEAGTTIWNAWVDGMSDGASGSQVGYDDSPFAEQAVVHGGKQSMPLAYDNDGTFREGTQYEKTGVPFYSQATREFESAQDWTGNGADEVGLWTQGYPAPTTVAVTETGGKMNVTGAGADIWNNSDEFTYAYKTLSGDGTLVARVVSNGTGSNAWAKGGVMIRDSLNGGSTHATMVMTAHSAASAAGNGASFQYRGATDGTSSNVDSGTV